MDKNDYHNNAFRLYYSKLFILVEEERRYVGAFNLSSQFILILSRGGRKISAFPDDVHDIIIHIFI